jgi:hypothetical protein
MGAATPSSQKPAKRTDKTVHRLAILHFMNKLIYLFFKLKVTDKRVKGLWIQPRLIWKVSASLPLRKVNTRRPPSWLFNGYGNKAKVRIGQLGERRVTQVNLSTFVDQMFGRAAIGDFNDNAPPGVRYDHPRAEMVKPRRCGEFVGIEPFAIGHQQAATLLPVPRRFVSGVTGHAPEENECHELHNGYSCSVYAMPEGKRGQRGVYPIYKSENPPDHNLNPNLNLLMVRGLRLGFAQKGEVRLPQQPLRSACLTDYWLNW